MTSGAALLSGLLLLCAAVALARGRRPMPMSDDPEETKHKAGREAWERLQRRRAEHAQLQRLYRAGELGKRTGSNVTAFWKVGA